MSDTNAWNLNRLLVVLAAACTFLSSIIFANYSVATWLASIPQLAPAFPGWIFAIVLAFYARPWVYLTAGILLSVLPLMVILLFGGMFAILQPISGGEYQSVILLLLALVLALTGGISGFRQGRKGAHTPLRGAMRTTKGLAVSLVAALLVGVFVTGGLAGAAVKEMAAAGGSYNVVPDHTVSLATKDFVFSPRELEIPAGQLVEIVIRNEDAAGHTFTYQVGGRTFDTFLPGDATVKVLVRFDAPQTIPFWCKPHSGGAGDASADSMTGRIVVA